MTLKEALKVVKVQIYEIHSLSGVVGCIERVVDESEDSSRPGLMFSNEDILDVLDSHVDEIIPQSYEVGKSKCVLVLEFF